MRFDVMTGGLGLTEMQSLAREAETLGYSGVVVTEGGRGAYLGCAAAALAADIDLLTGIAVAFPRSPMVTATTAWELADATGGRFRLGIGTQVRAHVERRYSAEFARPGPRMRDYLAAIRAIFRAFRGEEKLDYEGEFYRLSLLPAPWSPGRITAEDPPIDVAAVNPWMLRMVGEYADGVHVHPLNTTTYLETTVLPSLTAGAERSNRTLADLEVIVPAFIVVGDSPEERAARREMVRFQVAFYGSTPNYAFVFEQIGFEGTTERIREHQKAGDMAAMTTVITDEMLDHFVVTGTWDEIADRVRDRYSGRATRVVDYFSGFGYRSDKPIDARWAEVARAITAP